MKQTAIQWMIEKVDKQISIVQNSMKCRDDKYKYAADASITNLVVVKMGLQQALSMEREQIEEAYYNGVEKAINNDAISPSEYYNQTFKTESK